jgi:hypothetical protein
MEDKIIVYSTYYNPIEANIIKSRLEDSDIPCFLTDENISTIQPLYNQAVGGVKLNIFEKDIERINALLQEEIIFEDEPAVSEEDEPVACPNCKATNVSYGQATKSRFSWWVTLLSLIFFIYPFKAKNCYHCYQCGNEFK